MWQVSQWFADVKSHESAAYVMASELYNLELIEWANFTFSNIRV